MPVWSAEIKELERLYESFKGQLPELEKELGQLIQFDDPNVILLYSRRCLEVIITDLCECELKRQRGTEPLKGLIDKLNKEKKTPGHIASSMYGLNELSTYGTHPKDFDPEQVKPVLNNLDIIIKWYIKYREAGGITRQKPADKANLDINPIKEFKRQRSISDRNLRGIIAGLFILAAIIIAVIFFSNISKSGRIDKGTEKSIAVLPFKLLSDEPDKQYLADGMMDAIMLHLSKINDLRVMSRTSVEQYRGTTKTIRNIGRELNVAYLLEGSFQKFGDDTKLIVQLIKADKESHVWANEYSNKWSEVFSLQSDVAQKIASELMVAITPEVIEEMSEKPTENLEAYQAYLRGRYYAEQPHFTENNWKLALENYQEAVDMDTTFALAWGELARVHARLIFLRQDLSESRYKKAQQAAANASRLGHDQARVHIALGYYYLYAFRDETQALKHLEIAEKNLPNDVDVILEKSAIIMTRGRWDESINLLEKARLLIPHDASILTDLAEGYWVTRQYSKSIEACNQAMAVLPSNMWSYLFKIFTYWSWKGPCKESHDALEFVNVDHEWYSFAAFWQYVGEGKFNDALQLMSDTTLIWGTNTKMWAIPASMMKAFVYDHLNKSELAYAGYKDAVEILEKKIAEIPDDPRFHSSLGIAYAGLGRKEEAIKEGLRAVELLPVSKDAAYGLGHFQDLAIIYTRIGESEQALKHLEHLLNIPSWVSSVWIDWYIRFEPLKTHPGYKKLLAKYKINE
jgi:TolB-like protein/Flp pilus assembly protein TadD